MKPLVRCAVWSLPLLLGVFALAPAGCGGSGGDGGVGGENADGGTTGPGDEGGAAADGGGAGDGSGPGSPDGSPTGGDAAGPKGAMVLYASGYGTDISVFGVDEGSGALSAKSSVPAFAAAPSFSAVSPDSSQLFAVAENADEVGAYTIDAQSGALAFVNKKSSGGQGPAHVSVDRSGKYVLVANYTDGNIEVLPVTASGLGDPTDVRFAGKNAHMIVTDATNQYVFVPCLGDDLVAQYRFDATKGTLTPNSPPAVHTANNAGPRHIALHPSGAFAYVINEKDSTITGYSVSASGTLSAIETKSTLPAGFSGKNTGAEVWVHPSGKFVFGSNRGDDSIVTFSLDGAGKMTLVGHTKTGGTTPRDFTLDPAGRFLYVANQQSDSLTSFTVDAQTGALAPFGSAITITSPSFVGVVRLP